MSIKINLELRPAKGGVAMMYFLRAVTETRRISLLSFTTSAQGIVVATVYAANIQIS